MISFEDLRRDEEIVAHINAANKVLGEIGFTEHGLAHAVKTGTDASNILAVLNFDERTCELAKIAGLLHDIGNLVNRVDHAQSGALLAHSLLKERGFCTDEVLKISVAIGHHDDKTAAPVSPLAAALILADKSDVRSTRVRDKGTVSKDIHDRVNFAAIGSHLEIDGDNKLIILTLKIDTEICPVMEYFEIFLDRMILCKRSAAYLNCNFELIINNTRLL